MEEYNIEPRHTYNMDEKGFLTVVVVVVLINVQEHNVLASHGAWGRAKLYLQKAFRACRLATITVALLYIAHPPFNRSTCYYRHLDTYSSRPSSVRVLLSCPSLPRPCSSAPVLSSSP
ncbi:hypothetical protein BU23DRAFT_656427, partial [Bimuria novae-zelandiae CBS 107.79]